MLGEKISTAFQMPTGLFHFAAQNPRFSQASACASISVQIFYVLLVWGASVCRHNGSWILIARVLSAMKRAKIVMKSFEG